MRSWFSIGARTRTRYDDGVGPGAESPPVPARRRFTRWFTPRPGGGSWSPWRHSPTATHGDTLSFTRLQDMIGLTPGNLITHLRKLEDAGYVTSEKSGNGTASRTAVTLTQPGRAALAGYTATLRDLLDGL